MPPGGWTFEDGAPITDLALVALSESVTSQPSGMDIDDTEARPALAERTDEFLQGYYQALLEEDKAMKSMACQRNKLASTPTKASQCQHLSPLTSPSDKPCSLGTHFMHNGGAQPNGLPPRSPMPPRQRSLMSPKPHLPMGPPLCSSLFQQASPQHTSLPTGLCSPQQAQPSRATQEVTTAFAPGGSSLQGPFTTRIACELHLQSPTRAPASPSQPLAKAMRLTPQSPSGQQHQGQMEGAGAMHSLLTQPPTSPAVKRGLIFR